MSFVHSASSVIRAARYLLYFLIIYKDITVIVLACCHNFCFVCVHRQIIFLFAVLKYWKQMSFFASDDDSFRSVSADIYVSQRSVGMQVRCGGIFADVSLCVYC